MTKLIIDKISLGYKISEEELVTLSTDFSFNINEGEIVGIFGPNGCGKTTFFKSLLGEIPLLKGNIKFVKDGQVEGVPKYSYIPQNISKSFFLWASLQSNINFLLQDGKNFYKQKSKHKLINTLSKEFEINFFLGKKPGKCSGGMLQQAAIIRAFATKPDIILADEPFSALDVEAAIRIRKIFRTKIITTKTMSILISHNIDDLASICDKIIYIPNKPFTAIEGIKGVNRITIFNNESVTMYENADHHDFVKTKLESLFSK